MLLHVYNEPLNIKKSFPLKMFLKFCCLSRLHTQEFHLKINFLLNKYDLLIFLQEIVIILKVMLHHQQNL